MFTACSTKSIGCSSNEILYGRKVCDTISLIGDDGILTEGRERERSIHEKDAAIAIGPTSGRSRSGKECSSEVTVVTHFPGTLNKKINY